MIYPTLSKMRVLRYFSYTSVVADRIVEEKEDDGFSSLEKVYDECVKQASKLVNRMWEDNKSAFEILVNGHILYIGCYDGTYSLGFSVKGYGNRIYDFITNTESEYGENNS